MKKRIRLLALFTAGTLLLGGCGTPVHKMTEEEEDYVVQYAAYALAKHNIDQKDGMTDALPEEETQTEEPPEEAGENKEQTVADVSGGSSSSGYEEDGGSISLAGAIGHEKNLKVSYQGYTVKNSYKEGDYFSVNAQEGNSLVIMNFKIKNPTGRPVKVNTVTMDNPFSGCFDGENTIREKVFFGSKSLSSYEGKIAPGKTKDAVLIFELPKKTAGKIKDISLSVTMKDKTYSVEL